MTAHVPSHECWWYPIAYDEDGRPLLYACGEYRRCIKTITAQEIKRKRNKPEIRENPHE